MKNVAREFTFALFRPSWPMGQPSLDRPASVLEEFEAARGRPTRFAWLSPLVVCDDADRDLVQLGEELLEPLLVVEQRPVVGQCPR